MADTDSLTPSPTKSPPPKKRAGRKSRARGAANSSDAAAARWTVRGVPTNVREMVSKAADERGMTVGDMLAEAVVAYLKAEGSGTNLPATPTELSKLVEEMSSRLTRLEERHDQGIVRRLFGRREQPST